MCMYVPSGVCVCKLIRNQKSKLTNPVPLWHSDLFRRSEARQEDEKRRHWVKLDWSVKGKLGDPCSSNPWGGKQLLLRQQCSVYTYISPNTYTKHVQIGSLFWLVSAFTQKVKSWIKETLISVSIVSFWASTFEWLSLTIHNIHSFTKLFFYKQTNMRIG